MAKKYRLNDRALKCFGHDMDMTKNTVITVIHEYFIYRDMMLQGAWTVEFTDSLGRHRRDEIHPSNFEEIPLNYIKILKQVLDGGP